MGTQIPIPAGSYSIEGDVRASCRRLVNCFSELAPLTAQDDSPEFTLLLPVRLRRAPGITGLANDGSTNQTRGMHTMQGVLYTVIGSTLYTMNSAGSLTQVGTGISGIGFVRMTDNTACLVILLPGTNVGYTYDLASRTVKLITDENFIFYGAIDIGFDDTYIVFLSTDGRTVYNADSQTTSGQGPITFTVATALPREFGTDALVGMIVSNRGVMVFGVLTSEEYIDAGNPTGSPFSASPTSFQEQGCHPDCGYTIAKQNNAVSWVGNDRVVWNTASGRISNHGIESILEQADLSGSYAFTYSLGGHPMYVLQLPSEQRTLVYDFTTQQWHEMESFGLGFWRVLCCYNAFGKQLIGDSQSGQIGFLDSSVFTEFGTVRASYWIHQAVYDGNNRLSHRRVEIVLGQGYATLSGQGSNPMITCYVSDDGGVTFRALPMRSLGTIGQYINRAFWMNCGMARRRVYKFLLSDPVPSWVTDLQALLEGGQY